MLMYNTFIGRDLQEAINKMKMSMGADAMMLKQRVINTKGFFGLFKKPMVEVVGFKSNKMQNTQVTAKTNKKEDISLQKELLEIRKQLEMITQKDQSKIIKNNGHENENQLLYKYIDIMKDNDLSEEFIDKIMEAIKKEDNIEDIEDETIIIEKLKLKLKEIIEVVDPVKSKSKGPKIFMFVGPTGVGKTTSLVKLAANYKLKEDKQVEIYSLDNYRIAATEQLKTYAEIMQVPFKKFDNKIDFKNVLKQSKADIILIDTAGRSPKDEMSISALSDYLRAANFYKIDIFLVISASTKSRDILEIDQKYSRLNYKYLLATKLDETVSLGSLIDNLYYIKKPITYVTFGQDVPKHINLASPEILVDSIFSKEY